MGKVTRERGKGKRVVRGKEGERGMNGEEEGVLGAVGLGIQRLFWPNESLC